MARKSRAIVRYRRSKPVVKYRTRTVVKRARRRSKATPGGRLEIGAAVAAAATGYILSQTNVAESLPDALKPDSPKGKLALGVVGYMLNKRVVKNRYVGEAAKALIYIGAYELGQAGFELSGDDYGDM